MNNLVAFITVLFVWSTTQLAISIAAIGSSPIFGATSRMIIACIICLIILKIKRQKLQITQFYQVYIYAGSGIFITLSLVYLSSIYINSGIIAIVFALTPIITGIIANYIFKNNDFDFNKLLASIISFIGIFIVFFGSVSTNLDSYYLSLLFLGMSFQAFISIKLKQINQKAGSIQTTTGALLFSIIPFVLSFFIFEGNIPAIDNNAIFATIYLAIFGSVFGFVSYYYLIKNSSVLTVAIIPLITPIFALILGSYLNNETLNNIQHLGIVILLLGIIYYQFKNYAKS